MWKNLVFIVIVLLVVGTLYTLSRKVVIPTPPDEQHINVTSEKVCFDCHSEGKEKPISPKHPPKYECFKCHRLPGQ